MCSFLSLLFRSGNHTDGISVFLHFTVFVQIDEQRLFQWSCVVAFSRTLISRFRALCTDVVLDNGTKQCLDVFPLVLLVQQLIETTAQNACSEQRTSCTFYLILKWSLPPIVLINGLYVPKLNFCSWVMRKVCGLNVYKDNVFVCIDKENGVKNSV